MILKEDAPDVAAQELVSLSQGISAIDISGILLMQHTHGCKRAHDDGAPGSTWGRQLDRAWNDIASLRANHFTERDHSDAKPRHDETTERCYLATAIGPGTCDDSDTHDASASKPLVDEPRAGLPTLQCHAGTARGA